MGLILRKSFYCNFLKNKKKIILKNKNPPNSLPSEFGNGA